MSDYLDAAHTGRNEWWRYILSISVILFFWLVLGTLPTILLVAWYYLRNLMQGASLNLANMSELPMLPMFLATMLSFVFLLLGLFLAVRFIHQRKFISIVTPRTHVDWKRLWAGFSVWFVIIGIVSLIEAWLYPGRYQLFNSDNNFLLFALLSLILIPIQTSAEELLFRGYLIQSLGIKTRNIWILSISSGFLFGVLHLGNPEVASSFWLMAAYYIVFGVSLAIIALWDGRLELVLGLHAANNLFSALFAAYPNSAIRTPAIFMINILDPVYNLVAIILALIIFSGIFFIRKGRNQTFD